METRTTALFTKRPLPGAVKTRLCPSLAPEQAARLAGAMLEDVLARCLACPDFRTVLAFAPAEEAAWFAAAFPTADRRPQVGAGLGERMASFFEQELGGGARRTAVVIGSDAPLLPARRVVAAHRALERGADVVLGPDEGGGYYLVGLRRPRPELFTRIPMSTPDMGRATVALARELGLAVELLPPALDVDVEADLRRLAAELARPGAEPGLAPRTAAVVRELLTPWPDRGPR